MLEFIVLGRIPGTNLQITIGWFAVVLLILFIRFDRRLHQIETVKKAGSKKVKATNSRRTA